MIEELKTKKNVESEVHDAIAGFEQILEAMPDDRVALETLYEAHEQAGNKPRALEYLLRLGQSIADENDTDAAPVVLAKIRALGEGNPLAVGVVEKLENLIAPKTSNSTAERKGSDSKRKTIDISSELSMAWNLLQAGELTQEEYSGIVHDLSENSSKNVEVPISVMHVLHDRNFKTLEKIISFLVRDSGMPFISLTSFDIQETTYLLIPKDFMKHRGAIVFDLMGRDALVAILNPYDMACQNDIRKITGRNCHFYLTSAADYDSVLDHINKARLAAQQQGRG
jgi:hypothetical protein